MKWSNRTREYKVNNFHLAAQSAETAISHALSARLCISRGSREKAREHARAMHAATIAMMDNHGYTDKEALKLENDAFCAINDNKRLLVFGCIDDFVAHMATKRAKLLCSDEWVKQHITV